MELTKFFSNLSKESVGIAGGKGASLGEMTRAGIPVPNGFVVLSDSFEKFLEETDLNVEIDAILDSVNHNEMQSIENASEEIKALILNAKMPTDIEQKIKKDFKILNAKFVAVRSSATSEDSSSAAWAGQLDSFLNTKENTLLENVKRCWASLFTPRAIFYRFEKGLHTTKISVAVVVQKMVNSEISGIAFSVHPVTQDRNQLIIEAGFGLGEAIVSGSITPDSYVVEKNPRRIIDKNISDQEKGLFKVETGGSEWKSTKENGAKQKLTDKQIEELSEIILRIEKHYGFPCDIEWAFEGGKFFIVQSRPITTLLDKSNDNEMPSVVKGNQTKSNVAEKKVLRNSNEDSIQKYVSLLKSQPLDVKQAKCSILAADIVFGVYSNKVAYNESYSPVVHPYKWPNLQQVILEERMKGIERVIWTNAIKNKKRFTKVLKEGSALHKKIVKKVISDSKLSKLSQSQILKYFNELVELNKKWWEYAAIGEDKGLVVEEKLIPLLSKNHGLTPHEAQEYSSDMASPKGQSVFSKERIAFLELCLILSKNKTLFNLVKKGESLPKNKFSLFSKKINDYSKKYFYSRTDFYRGQKINNFTLPKLVFEELNKTTFSKLNHELMILKNSEKELEKRQKEWSKRVSSLTKEEKDYLWYSKIMHTWIDERKVCMVSQFSYLFSILEEISLRRNISYDKIALLNVSELKNFIEDGTIDFDLIKKRGEGSVFVYEKNKPVVEFFGKEAELFNEAINKHSSSETITGTIASKGNGEKIIVGRVKIVHDPFKDSFAEGEVLVTTMTRPEFVPMMKKAIAIVTDEGGLTSHAAIVSRELGVPCIIGTKNATKLLKDGDIVEVDANKGIVKILTTNKIDSLEKTNLVFEKSITRDWSIIYAEIWHKVFTSEFKKQLGWGYTEVVFEGKNNSITIYRAPSEHIDGMRDFILANLDKDKNWLKNHAKIVKKMVSKAISWMDSVEKKDLSNYSSKELATIFDEFVKMNLELGPRFIMMLWFPIQMEKHHKANQYKEAVKVAIGTREEIEKVGPLVDTLARKIADEVTQRAKLDKSLSRFISINQIEDYLKNKIIPDNKDLFLRNKYFIITNEGILSEEFESYLARKKYSLNKIDLSNITTIKGNPAYPGVVRGIVKIIKNKDSFSKLKEGEILVTGMTTPDFLPVMKKTAGFVTDEGGITCHAAIVARELKKPCIIGTKIATEVLHDGDLVEVDANTGIVKILESSIKKKSLIEPIELNKIYSREKSLLYYRMWNDSDRKGYEKYLNHKVKNNLFIISQSGEKGSVWYNSEELKEIEKKFLKIYKTNPKIIIEILKDITNSWKVLQNYLSIGVSSLDDFKKYYLNLVDFWAGWNIIINVPDYDWVSQEDKQRVLDSRKETEKYSEKLSDLLNDFVDKEHPSLKKYSFFIDFEEVLKSNPNIVEKLQERKNGCFLINGELYLKNELENVLKKNNLKLGVELNSSKEGSKEKYFFARERPWLFNPVYWNPVVQTSKEIEEIYGTSLSVEWNIYKEGRMRVIIPQEEWDRLGEFIANKMFSDKRYFDNLISKTKSAKKEIDSFLTKSKKQDYSKFSLKELNALVKEIYSLFMKYDSASVFSWFVAGDLFKEKVHNKLGLSWEGFEVISLPEEKTFVSKLDEDLLKAALLKNSSLQAANLSNKYYWVPFGYDGPSIWDKKYFLEKINSIKDNPKLVKKELMELKENDLNKKKKIKIILSKISKDKQSIELLKRMHYLTLWTDERKMLEFQLFYYYNLVLERIGKLTGFSVIQLKHLTVEEILLISQEKNSLIQKANERINNPFLTIIKKGKVDFCTNEEYEEMYAKIEKQLSSTELKGTVACKGSKEKYVAKVKVASSPKDAEKLLEGEFLVASMTTPEYIVSMKKAIGFITDEGGVTCHAAIVAREMNKPCVIGTKVATKVLKDGDLVEVDVSTGIVKKIS